MLLHSGQDRGQIHGPNGGYFNIYLLILEYRKAIFSLLINNMKLYWIVILAIIIIVSILLYIEITTVNYTGMVQARLKKSKEIYNDTHKSCLAYPYSPSEGLINDAALVCEILKHFGKTPRIHFENITKECDTEDWIFINLDYSWFKYHRGFVPLFNTKKGPRTLLCKNKITFQLMNQIAPKNFTVLYTGFTSIDIYVPDIEKDYSKFLHLPGKSPAKGTVNVIRTWLLHPEWPTITIICRGQCYKMIRRKFGNIDALNIKIINEFLPYSTIVEYINHSGVHICTSEFEGFGHYINEARAVKAVILYTDGPPMNEMLDESSGIKIKCNVTSLSTPNKVGPASEFSPKDLEDGMNRLALLGNHDLILMGNNARNMYLHDKTLFENRLKTYVTEWNKKQKVHILHPIKTGGLSLRKAVGCDCSGIDKDHGEIEEGTTNCHKTTSAKRFVCHGHILIL